MWFFYSLLHQFPMGSPICRCKFSYMLYNNIPGIWNIFGDRHNFHRSAGVLPRVCGFSIIVNQEFIIPLQPVLSTCSLNIRMQCTLTVLFVWRELSSNCVRSNFVLIFKRHSFPGTPIVQNQWDTNLGKLLD